MIFPKASMLTSGVRRGVSAVAAASKQRSFAALAGFNGSGCCCSNCYARTAPRQVLPQGHNARLLSSSTLVPGTVQQKSTAATATFASPQLRSFQSAAKASPVVLDKIQEAFPGALTSSELSARLEDILAPHGYIKEKSLLATSLCCDEVNRTLEDDLRTNFEQNFHMGGLAGFAFGGVTSFGAMAAHIPSGGHCLVVYGPHVGIDADGVVGKVNRRGQAKSGACCGSAAAAAAYVSDVHTGKITASAIPTESMVDAQQAWVGHQLLPHAERLANAAEPDVELPKSLFDAQDEVMMEIIQQGAGSMPEPDGLIGMLGGIQINTPTSSEEYFLPIRFELRNTQGAVVENLLEKVLS